MLRQTSALTVFGACADPTSRPAVHPAGRATRGSQFVEVYRSAKLAQALGGNGNFTVTYQPGPDQRVTTATLSLGGS